MVLFRRSCSLLQSRIDLALFNRASQLGRALPYFCFAPVEPCSSALVTNSRRHHNSFPRRPGGDGRDRRQSGSKQQSELEKESFAEDNDKELWRHLRRRINDQQAQAKKEPIGSERRRQLQSSIANLTFTMNELQNTREQKKGANAPLSDSTIQKSPSNATIEILSNGTANVRPCVALRTTFQLYLFDCPEGTYRHMCGTRLNHRSLFDVFITRGDWEHTGGVPGVVVSKEQFQHKLRLHGPPHMKRFIETFRSFQSDDGKVRTTLEVEELTFDIGKFEDEALIVHYLPLVESTLPTADPFLPSKRRLTKSDEVNRLSLSYLVELKKRPSRIDAAKCLSLGVPKGPMIGHLQRGMTVTLADGRVIKPEDVWLTVDGEEPRQPAVLVVNCPTLSLLPSLVNASALQRYKNSEASDPTSPYLKYVVHYTNDQTLRSDEYVEWMASFGSDTTHLVVNGSGPILPHSDGVYRMQTQLNFLHADIFPNLASHGYSGMLPNAPVETSLGKVNVVVGEPFMSFPLRGRQPIEEDTVYDFDRDAAILAMKESPDFETLFAKFRKEVAAVSVEETFPRLTILGSSSATPTKFRNMSGYFVELSDDFCFFVDCGEGTYGQLLALFGPQRTAELLIKLKFIFLSHGHQDHVIGIFDLVLERRKAFLAAEKTFTPLRVLAPTIVFPTMNMYDMSIEKMTDYFEATLTTRPRTQEETAGDLWDKDGVIDVGSYIPGFESWPVKQLRVVTVHHPRQAKALILETTDGKKLVFSGDTKPCNRLIAAGKDADLLVHEATFCDEFTRDAEKKSHSTMSQAVEVGEKMNAKMTLLTHFSARYKKVPLMPTYLDAKGNVGIVMDNMVVRWSELPLIPRLIPLFRAIYSNEIDDVKTQLSKRNFKKMNSLVPNADPEQSPKIAKKAQRLV